MSDSDAGADRDGITRPTIWIFHGERARYAAGAFTTSEAGLAWAAEHHVVAGRWCIEWKVWIPVCAAR